MLRQLGIGVLMITVLACGGLANRALAQGCCKAGTCRLPTLPSGGGSLASTDLARLNFGASRATSQQTAATVAAPAPAAAAQATLVISNPVGSQSSVEYTLDGKSYSLQPGMSLSIATGRPWKIEFPRGQQAETAQYRVSQGAYEFAHTNRGWELYRLARSN